MHSFLHTVFVFFVHLGALGLLILGVLDSSFLFLPLGNDLLLMVLTVRHHSLLPLFVAAAAAGSTLGCFLLDLVVRRQGGAGIRKILSAKRIKYVESKVKDRAATALLVATLAPPPFPFTPVIAAVSALHYPRGRMLGIIAAGRAVRFTVIGLLAIWLGRRLLRITQTPAFEWSMAAFIALCVIGSAFSIYRWINGAGRTAAP
ncbi:MAG: VTT domain-containing protein [Acidobacteriota bacterium]|nr:VTT domain-containing protein [Acidobacteriota bacterium]